MSSSPREHDTRPTEHVQGIVERVTYHAEDSGYTVARLKAPGHRDLVTIVGRFPDIHAGQSLRLVGYWRDHAKYGQLSVPEPRRPFQHLVLYVVDILTTRHFRQHFLYCSIAALPLQRAEVAARHLETFPLTEVMKSGGTVALAYAAQAKRVKLLALLQLLGFFIIFTCMILMRFGL